MTNLCLSEALALVVRWSVPYSMMAVQTCTDVRIMPTSYVRMKATVRKMPAGKLTASRLRADVYRVLDGVLETGVPAVVQRRGRTLRIVPGKPVGRLDRLVARPDFIKGDPEDLVRLDWLHEWRP